MRRLAAFFLAAGLGVGLPSACAAAAGARDSSSQPATAASGPALSPRERLQKNLELQRKLEALDQQVIDLFGEKKYEEAAGACRQVIELAPTRPVGHYNLACALARLGKKEPAFASLKKAAELGFSDAEHMKVDDDLATLREDKRFADLVKSAEENADKGAAFPYDKGQEMRGVKTVEDAVKGGLRYRLRMDPNATKEKPDRLVVWLHPSGGYGNSLAEPLAPMLLRHGLALLVFTQKQAALWTSTDFERAKKTVQEVGKMAGIDANRPILMGFSAGGMMALWAWAEKPGELGGLVLDAAYPIDAQASTRARVVLASLPKDPSFKDTPIFVAVGGDDRGSQYWKKVHPDWLKAGVPLEVHYVPGRQHEWLFNNKTLTSDLDKWIAAVSAGKLPTNQPAPVPASASAPASAPAPRPADVTETPLN